MLLASVFIPVSLFYESLTLLSGQAVLPSNLNWLAWLNAILVPQHLTFYFFFKSDTVCSLCYTSLLPLMLFPHQSLQMYSKEHPNLNFKTRHFLNCCCFEWPTHYKYSFKMGVMDKKVIMAESQQRRLYIWGQRNWFHIETIRIYSEEQLTLFIQQFFI